MLHTPRKSLSLILLAAFLYLTAPLVEWWYYAAELERGSFPVNADSIAIPLFQFTFGWLTGAPVAAFLIWFCVRDYQGNHSLFGFNRKRLIWSLIWTVAFGWLFVSNLIDFGQSICAGQPFDAIQNILCAYLVLCLRASVVNRGDAFGNR